MYYQDSASFDRFIAKLDTAVFPRYLKVAKDSKNSKDTIVDIDVDTIVDANKPSQTYEYPAWQLTAFYVKLLRNLAGSVHEDVLMGFESKVVCTCALLCECAGIVHV